MSIPLSLIIGRNFTINRDELHIANNYFALKIDNCIIVSLSILINPKKRNIITKNFRQYNQSNIHPCSKHQAKHKGHENRNFSNKKKVLIHRYARFEKY